MAPPRHLLPHLALLLALLSTTIAARADAIAAVDSVRRTGCGGAPGGHAPLRRRDALDATARRLAAGAEIGAALAASGYRANQAFAAHVAGADTEAAIASVLARDFCARMLDGRWREAGSHRHGAAAWVVLAAPAEVPALTDPRHVAQRVLALINTARAAPRQCGVRTFAAAAPLAWSAMLAAAAQGHAVDMERRDQLDHTGSDGSTPLQRVLRAGYVARTAGENIARNQESAEEVVRAWLTSPHHCANLMDPRFRELGLAFVVSRRREQSIYWDLTLAAPRHL
ncbi:MAG: CAP domain-containing protein [Gammaproteobacteria bacterium]|nr:CAP domain-containing protein [Gammaproteobacteria bacterium]